MSKLFNKILIANRGEIACRVMRTAKQLGIKTVAVYSEPDARAMHVRMADEAVCIGPAASRESYLRGDKIIEVMKQVGAQAVHPGYGFLSENAGFSEQVEQAGLIFIGPSAFSMRAMGDKIESKKVAAKAGVTTIPGFAGVIADPEMAVKVANEVGYPIMLKASAGGGGKGMRIAYNDAETKAGFALSSREAASSFGDDRILIERFVEEPRHIEIQLIADNHGNCVYLTERECSIQRRNQKVIEEAPAANLSREAVKRMGEEAVALAKAVGYRSAGTVEFLVDKHENHFFLEMNTRLQVEHPVTEQVTGLDLVEIMLRVAAGEKLPLTQEDVKRIGWAMESRVYAEDPLKKFLPSTGALTTYRHPKLDDVSAAVAVNTAGVAASNIPDTVRVDDGVCEAGEISIHYDPMIAKLVTHGANRERARQLMLGALDRYAIRGVRHNINFLRSIMSNKRFAEGRLTTKFIPEEWPDGYQGHVLSDSDRYDLLACTSALQLASDVRAASVGKTLPWANQYCVRLDAADETDVTVNVKEIGNEDKVKTLFLEAFDSSCSSLWSRTMKLKKTGLDPGMILEATLQDGNDPAAKPRAVGLQIVGKKPLGWQICAFGTTYTLLSRPPKFAQYQKYMLPPPKSPFADALLSPMPGALLAVNVKVGDSVTEGQELCVVEAMKMQNPLFATRDGKVKEILAPAGSILAADQPILLFEESGK